MAVELHIHRRVAVELQLAAVFEGDLPTLADAGTLVGHPHRQVLQAPPTAQQHAKQAQHLGTAWALRAKRAIQGHARRLRGQGIEAAPKAAHAFNCHRVTRIGLAPGVESLALGVRDRPRRAGVSANSPLAQ